MRTKIRILTLLSLFFLLAALAVVGMTYGWFGQSVTFTTENIAAGDLRYTETGAFIANDTIVVPGQELIATPIAVDNDSPITSQLRVLVTYDRCTNPGTVTCVETTYADAVDDHLAVTFGTGFSYISGYWYYTPGTPVTTYEIAAASGPMTIITSISYDGDLTGIDYGGQNVSVSVTIQVKQADNVAWTSLSGYDFATGYPA
ncbi:MAG: hypothetical protein WC509_08760 [Candidatus Izemoplasmatales bacterium]